MKTQEFQPLSICICLLLLLPFGGCATTNTSARSPESQKEAVSAMGKVLGSVSGEEIDEKKLRKLNSDIQKDPQAKSAVQTIANTVSGQGQIIKYCPVDGQRYGAKFADCPDHKVPLKILTE